MQIYYCDACHTRIPNAELEAQTALVIDENKALCAKCAPAAKSARRTGPVRLPDSAAMGLDPRSSRTGLRAATRSGQSGSQAPAARSGTSSSRTPAVAPSEPEAELELELLPDAGDPPTRSKLPLLIGAGGAVLFLIGLIFTMRGGKEEPGKSAETKTATAKAREATQPNAPAPATKGNEPTQVARPLTTETTPKTPSEKAAAPAPATGPDAAASVPAPKTAPIEVPNAPDETIWLEDDLPGGATVGGTLKADSWKWIAQPDPVYSGLRSHSAVGDGKDEWRQHCFQGANPPLQVNPWDVLVAYVYLDPKNIPKEIMMQWHVRGGWEHRAYWGDDLINLGQAFSPSKMQSGPLPKAGAWVRLEVRGSEIGIEAENEAVTGWSFDQFGGTVYWDRAGVASKPKPATVAATATPPTPPPTPAPAVARQPTPGKEMVSLAGFNSVAALTWKDFKGGGDHPNFGGKAKTGKAIWGKRSTRHTTTASFTLKPDFYDTGVMVVLSFREWRPEPAAIVFAINGQEVYNGKDTSTKQGDWSEQRYPIPAGILRGGQNDIRISNLNDSNNEGALWYMFNSMEIMASTRREFTPIVSDAQRATLQAFERTFEQLAKKDADPAMKIDQALRLAKSVNAPELQPLVSVLEKAQALYNQAIANLTKQPPTDQVNIEKMKLKGTIARIAGGKAFIKSQGIEMPVDVSLLPPELFLRALAFDDSKPAGLADRAAYMFGLGSLEASQNLLKRLKKDDVPAWTALYDRRASVERVLKFEAAVGGVESAIKSGKGADALAALNAMKKDYADLAEANKERIDYLVTVAEGPKK